MKNTDLFYNYFIVQHGEEKFNKIRDMILAKVGEFKYPVEKYMSKEEFNKLYVMFVFEVALADFWGMTDDEISNYIKMIMGNSVISKVGAKKVKEIHADAIKEIHVCFQDLKEDREYMSEDEKLINSLFFKKLSNFSVRKWRKKDKDYKKKIEAFYNSMDDLNKFSKAKLSENEMKEYRIKLEKATNDIYNYQLEEKRLFYIEGYKDGVHSMKELFDEI